MIKVIAENFFKKNKIDEALELYKELILLTRKEKGCLKYELFQNTKEKEILTMIEEWENLDYLKNHFESDHFKKIVPQLENFFEKESKINLYKKII